MTLRPKIWQALESFLRVPPLIIVDEILRNSFGLGLSKFSGASAPYGDGVLLSESSSNTSHFPGAWYSGLLIQPWIWKAIQSWLPGLNYAGPGSEVNPDAPSEYLLHISLGGAEWSIIHQMFSNDLLRCFEVLICLILFSSMVVIFVLSAEHIVKLYGQYAACMILYVAYVLNPIPMSLDALTEAFVVYTLAVRIGLCIAYVLLTSWLTSGSQEQNESTVLNYLIVPLFFVTGVIQMSPVIYIILVLVLENSIRQNIFTLCNFLRVSWDETKRIRHEFGINHLIHVHSGRLRLNTVFKLFWISRATYDAMHQCCDTSPDQAFKYVMTHGTETLTGVVGITAVISSIANQFGELILWILYCGGNSESDANRFGSISTVLFFILSLQTGLTTLEPEKRLDRLTKNFALLATALLHALHQMVSPILHAYRTLQGVQIRAVVLSLTFLGIALYSTVWLLTNCAISTWSLAVLALAIEFKVKVTVSLIITTVLYMSQMIVQPEPLRKMGELAKLILPSGVTRFGSHLCDEISHEDVIFYLKTFANIAEFVTGIFLFTNAIYIFLFESASAIRAIGMSIHAYFNIWCEAKKGWKIFCQRRTAAVKIMSLKDASEKQLLERKDDVCAICYEEMENAKLTVCNHLFHAVCLRKWLYLQNTCPLCQDLLYSEDVLAQDPAQLQQDAGSRIRAQIRLANRTASAAAQADNDDQHSESDVHPDEFTDNENDFGDSDVDDVDNMEQPNDLMLLF